MADVGDRRRGRLYLRAGFVLGKSPGLPVISALIVDLLVLVALLTVYWPPVPQAAG